MLATIVIPTLNAGASFTDVLTSCEGQQAGGDVEVLVIDSGSTDGTDERALRHGARLHRIPNSEFGHGRTRNLGAHLSDAEFVVFLTQDATPADDRWLASLLAPFWLSERIAATYARQAPRGDCRPTARRDITSTFARLGPTEGVVVHGPGFTSGDEPTFERAFLSNVSSAVRRSVLAQVPFRDVAYAEDRALAADLHEAGWLTAYAPTAVVLHSHDYALGEYFLRMVDEFSGLRDAVGEAPRVGVVRHVGAALVGSANDAAAALTTPDQPWWRRILWGVTAPAFQVARRVGIAVGRSRRLSPLARRWSLEDRRRRGAVPDLTERQP